MWKDSETEIDYLDYEYLVHIITDIINNDSLLPASIGVYGDWGSGKSSLMHMCISQLENSENGKTKCILFNGWLFESYSDAKAAFLNNILDALQEGRTLTDKAKVILKGLYKSVNKFGLAENALKYGIKAATSIATGGAALIPLTVETVYDSLNNVNSKEVEQNVINEWAYKELRDDIRTFQEQFTELLEVSKVDRLAIFVDELDRCREDTILDTLEAMRLFMFTGKVAFIIGADERHISYAVKSKFKNIEGIQIDIGKEYLEKLVQYPIRIPRMGIAETEIYITLLLLSKELPEETFEKIETDVDKKRKENLLKSPFSRIDIKNACSNDEGYINKYKECVAIGEQLSAVLSPGLHGNPRQVKRFLNMLDMRIKMAKYKGKELDRKILAKIMVLEYIRSASFNKLAEMAFDGTLINELELLEDKKQSDKSALYGWLKDDWLKEWLMISPSLKGKDLANYFYFARTSLDEKISRVSTRLSPEGQEILDKLLSGADINIKQALNRPISDAEAANILEAIGIQMQKQTEISRETMKAFIDFSLNKPERYSTAFSILGQLPVSSLSMSVMPSIEEFASKTSYKEDVAALVEKWGIKNPQLKKAFQGASNAQKI